MAIERGEVGMWCAQCGKAMTRRQDGAWHACCDRLGYWSDAKPLPRDGWWPVTQRNGLTFYPAGNWSGRLVPADGGSASG